MKDLFLLIVASFLFLSKLLNCAEFDAASIDKETLFNQKQEILDVLVAKFNEVIKPLQVSAIPWERVDTIGWPEQVESKLTKEWTQSDLVILREQLGSIHFGRQITGPPPSQPSFWRQNDCERILAGTYSNTTFDRFSERYRVISIIGSGSFGFVLKCERITDGLVCAVKFIFKQKINPLLYAWNPAYGRVPVEVDYLSRISHPGVIDFLDYFDDGAYGYLVTELFGKDWSTAESEDGSLYDLFEALYFHDTQPFTDELIHFIFSQVYKVVLDLQSVNIYHGDIKIENVLMDANYRIKLADFGIARAIPRDSLNQEGFFTGIIGSEPIFAPEMIMEIPYLASQVETWSLGVMLYFLKGRRLPFDSKQATVYAPLKIPFSDESGKRFKSEALFLFILM
jgi:hypothetical protein